MTSDIKREYQRHRREHPFMPAAHALSWAKGEAKAKEPWEYSTGSDEMYEQEIDGFKVTLCFKGDSIYPEPDRHGNTDYGRYVDERGSARWGWDGEWNGNWPEPAEHATFEVIERNGQHARWREIRFPYTAIRYSGPGWTQGEGSGYFIPDCIEDQFDYYRRSGQSRSVAWDLTREWIEAQLKMLFSSPLTNGPVEVTVSKEDIELASTSIWTDISGDEEGYIFVCADDYGLVEEALEQARENIDKLTAA